VAASTRLSPSSRSFLGPIEHATEDIFPLEPVLARTRAGTNILAHRQDGMQQIHPHVTAGDGGHVVPRQRNGHIERATEYRRIDGRFRQEDKLGKRVDEPVLSIVGRRRREDATQRRRQKGTSAGMRENPLLDGARAQDASLGHGQRARRSTIADLGRLALPRIDLDRHPE